MKRKEIADKKLRDRATQFQLKRKSPGSHQLLKRLGAASHRFGRHILGPGGLRFVLIIALLAILYSSGVQQIKAKPALDALSCESYPTFPIPWQTIQGSTLVGGGGGYIKNALVIASPSNFYEASASLTSGIRNLYSVTVSVYFLSTAGASDTADLAIFAYMKGSPVAQQIKALPSDSNWHTLKFFFDPPGVSRDTTIVILRNDDPDLAIQVNEQCFLNLPTPTPDPIPTLASSNTPFPTDTPAPTTTPLPTSTTPPTDTPAPTASDTPLPSDTPTGTIAPTSRPTLTPMPSHSPAPATISSGSISTPLPPKACADPFNPCGALPFPVPNLPALGLQSPIPVTVASFAGTSTPLGSPTAFGPASGTTTGTPDIGGFYEFGTNVAGAADAIITTPVLLDAGGFAVSVGDGAQQLGQQVGVFFAVVRVAQSFFLGRTGNIIASLFLMVLVIVLVRLICFAIPIIRKISDWIFSIVKMLPFA